MKNYTLREYSEYHTSVMVYGLRRKKTKKEIIEFIEN